MKTQVFRKKVRAYYRSHGRELPWRPPALPLRNDVLDPYAIAVSEIMLQQTQVDRVIKKYEAWMTRWPTWEKLARARQRSVVSAWQGLGYNRRALNLHRCARAVAADHDGQLPRDESSLLKLPGIGPYTAGAIRAFSFNEPVVMIETNIRAVFLHHYWSRQNDVTDASVLPLIEETLDRRNPREWYWALMDYGSFLKRAHPNPSRRSKHHVRQSAFEGSDRQIRGAVLRLLTEERQVQRNILSKTLSYDNTRIESAVSALISEGFVADQNSMLMLA